MEHYDRPAKRIRRESSTGESPQLCRELGLMRRRSDHDSVSFVGSASGIHFVQSVYNAVANEPSSNLSATVQSPDQDAVPGEDDQLPVNSVSRGTKEFWLPGEVCVIPPHIRHHAGLDTFERLLRWSQSFWDNWHPAYPFLHAPTVLEWFQTIASCGIVNMESNLDMHKIAIVRSIMSISLSDRRQLGELPSIELVPETLVFESFSKAIESVQSTLVNPPDLEALQALVSVELFLISILRHNAASRLGGLIVRMVFQMGLHRCPARYPTFSSHERELRQRLFWTIYCIDRHICQSLGSPLTLRDDDLDVCYFDKERHSAEGAHVPEMDDRLALLNFLAKHGEIKGLILELCHKSINHRKAQHDQANLINGKITKWANDIEQFLDNYSPESSPLAKSHQTILTVLKHECIIALDRPLLTSPADPSYDNGLQSCISASRAIIKCLSAPSSKVEIEGARLALLWPSMTWAVWMSAFVMLFAAIKQEVPKPAAIRCAQQSIDILKRLSSRGNVWPSACAAAIRDLCGRLNQENGQARSLDERTPSSETIGPDVEPPRSGVGGLPSRRADNLAPFGNVGSAPRQTIYVDKANVNGGIDRERVYVDTGSPADASNGGGGDVPSSAAPFFSPLDGFRDIDLFDGFDIPFYLGDDQYGAWMP